MDDRTSMFRSADQPSQLILRMARPDIYRINAFRILQLPVTASPSEVSSQLRKLDLADKFGDLAQRQSDILPLSPTPDSHSRRQAAQRLNDPESRLIDELFWFWPLRYQRSGDKDEALAAMNASKSSLAVSIWTHHELKGSEANISMHNLAVLYHILALDLEYADESSPLSKQQSQQKQDYWKAALSRWQFLLGYDLFWRQLSNRIRELDDPRLPPRAATTIRDRLSFVLLSINATLAARFAQLGNGDEANYHVRLMRTSGFGDAAVDEALRQSVAPLRDRLKAICANSEDATNKSPELGAQIAHELLNQASVLLSTFDTLFSTDHPILQAAHDQIARQILKCSIAFANKTEEWQASIELLTKAEQIAASPSLRQRIRSNVETFQMNMEYGICWFCQQQSADAKALDFVEMHRDVTRDETWRGTEVHWRRIAVPVPRCSRCKSAHTSYKAFKILGPVLGSLLGLAGCINVMSQTDNAFLSLVTLAITGLSGFGIGIGIARLSTRGVKSESAKLKFSAVQKAQSDGWTLGGKPPGVN